MAEILRRAFKNIQEKTAAVTTYKTDVQSNNFYELDNDLLNQNIKDLVNNSDACMSEIEYVLGSRDSDPHPEHQIDFDAKASDASRLL